MDTLPIEILTRILDLLPFDDRRKMAMMNKTWYNASLHPILLHRECLHYHENRQKYDVFTNALLKTERKLLKLKLWKTSFDHVKYLTIFKNLGDRIISLHLFDISIVDDVYLEAITGYCKNLKKLELSNITIKICKPCTPIPELHSITLDRVHNISDFEFNLFVQCAPNVKNFSLIVCEILYGSQGIRTFYSGNERANYNSGHIFTFVNILNYLSNAKSIKKLKIDKNFQIFCRLPKHLKLYSLSVSLEHYYLGEESSLEEFRLKLAEHTSLKKLVISHIPCCFLSAISKLYNLNYLEVSYTTKMQFNCLNYLICFQKFCDSLKGIKNLKTLIITRIKPFFQYNLTAIIPEHTLKSLKLLNSPIERVSVITMGQQLDILNIQCSKYILQFHDFQLLFRKLTNLRQLKIDDCSELTDYVLRTSPISNIKGLNILHLFKTRLTHRILGHFELLHLEHLIITDLSLKGHKKLKDIDSGIVLDFKESMKQLGNSTPVLTTLKLYMPNYELPLPHYNKMNENLRKFFLKPEAYLDNFKNLKTFQIKYCGLPEISIMIFSSKDQ